MRLERTIALAVFSLIGLFALYGFTVRPETVKTSKDAAAAEVKTEAQNKPSETQKKTYSYSAQSGDSYSVLARKAVQTYGLINKVKLSHAQILAAENDLTTRAGSPYLNEGQSVTFDTTVVRSAIEAAQKLSAASQAEWQVYVADVDFNTNRVGQSR